MPEAAVFVEPAYSIAPKVAEENRKKSFSLNVGVFLLLWVGLHLLLRAMGWAGDYAMLVFVPALYGAYFLVRAVPPLYCYHYKLSLLALGIAVLYLLIGVKLGRPEGWTG
jgi:hypothetical protein